MADYHNTGMEERMMQSFLTKARRGEPVFLADVVKAFSGEQRRICCELEPIIGDKRAWEIRLPEAHSAEELAFVKEYFYARLYNLISTFGGTRVILTIAPGDAYAKVLCETLEETFQLGVKKNLRSGYGKCLNVTDRINAAMGAKPFQFTVVEAGCPVVTSAPQKATDAVSSFKSAVNKARGAALCGIDIGGTDIKVVGIRGGHVVAVKEYDWNPAEMTSIDQVIEPVLLMARVIRSAMSLPDTAEAGQLKEEMLKKGVSDEAMKSAADTVRTVFGEPLLLDGIGVCFPDVVIDGHDRWRRRNASKRAASARIRGLRQRISRLAELKRMLLKQCRSGGVVSYEQRRIAGRVHSGGGTGAFRTRGGRSDGVFAHTLGTELGTGWIDETGEIPQNSARGVQLRIDLGSYLRARLIPWTSAASTTLTPAFRERSRNTAVRAAHTALALKVFEEQAPARYAELFDKGFLERKMAGFTSFSTERICEKRCSSTSWSLRRTANPPRRNLPHIGEYLAVTFEETERMLHPKTKSARTVRAVCQEKALLCAPAGRRKPAAECNAPRGRRQHGVHAADERPQRRPRAHGGAVRSGGRCGVLCGFGSLAGH